MIIDSICVEIPRFVSKTGNVLPVNIVFSVLPGNVINSVFLVLSVLLVLFIRLIDIRLLA